MTAAALPRPGATARWQWRRLLLAPHRLAFFLAMVVLVAAGLWWALVLFDRAGAAIGLSHAVSPTTVHSTVMAFGFMPLFFAGFLFTAGPRWLGVRGPAAREIATPLLLMSGGWLLWLVAAQVHVGLALAALLLVQTGLAAVTARFWRLVLASDAPDRIHAKAVGCALVAGVCSLGGLAIALAAGLPGAARGFVLTGLWSFVIAIFVIVAHRMIPFFTSSALPMVDAWRPFWVLGALLGVALFEASAVWLDGMLAGSAAWLVLRGLVEMAAAAVVVWLMFAWGLVQSLKVRLLAMLHLGFLWLGLGLALSGASTLGAAFTGTPLLPLAGLHAITMGCLGSLMLAMVTRVSCGHSGRPLVADNPIWTLFLLLQAATLLRVAAAVPQAPSALLAAAAAGVWAGVMAAWGIRYGSWYGHARADGRPG
ncbi:NnrS family protein [Ramlibacter sp. WS9]|uniref:NnrS family protein n=1 Tax=Ramlibacter sp. WS9 TaxID=1882741 RepID=UPI001142119C|nr:NnrS family protein [Ramlibacter sp. WS9]ROZ75449.1 NnrS family protein [Ramlibacter sp. WS9]